MPRHDDQFPSTARFRIQRCLGRGSYGVVYLAHDVKRDGEVALKSLTNLEAGSLYRFKQEFRSLADVRHPNLVRLYELFGDDDRWFFTMELVEGVDWRRYVAPGALAPADAAKMTMAVEGESAGAQNVLTGTSARIPYDPNRLRSAVRQLAEGVDALHCHGKVHRDLKPSNVLITETGRVVVLDFGLIKELDSGGVAETIHVIGTPAYMSPEQGEGRPLSAASDWYSVGMMLYEVLRGELPVHGSIIDVLRHRQRWQPTAADFPPDTPADLATLCMQLLQLDPDQRPSGAEILARLGTTDTIPARPRVEQSSTGPVFVGREAERDRLRAAFDAVLHGGRPSTLFVHGSSGIGKTALVHRFLDELRSRPSDAVILQARCYEQESVPYKGFDGLIDALIQHLKAVPPPILHQVLPRELHVLARLFPALDEIGAALTPPRVQPTTDPRELRRRGARALRELLTRLADVAPLVLFIDDLHWGDADTARLLQEILRPPDGPVLLFIATYRSEEAETSTCVRELIDFARREAAGIGYADLRVGGISIEEGAELVRSLHGPAVPLEFAQQIARESDGVPFFLHQLVLDRQESTSPADLASDRGVDAVVSRRLLHLDEDARVVMELLAIAGRPVERTILVEAAAVQSHAAVLDSLVERRFVRFRRSLEREEVEIYHAKMVSGVARHLSAPALAQRHRQLAEALERAGGADVEALYVHYHQAGDRSRAATFAVAAAHEASQALAFNRAADLYASALADSPSDSMRSIRISLADALANAGRGEEAARAYLAAAADAPTMEQLQLRQRAVGQFFRVGRFDDGLTTLRALLPSLRLSWPEGRWVLPHLLFRRLQLRLRGLSFRETPAEACAIDDLVRIDACWSIADGLSVVDTVRARFFQTQGLIWALDAGEPQRIVRAMGLEAVFSSTGGGRTRRRTEDLFRWVFELSDRVQTADGRGVALIARGAAHHLCGEWKRATEVLREAERFLAEAQFESRAFGLNNVHVFALAARTYLGEIHEVRTQLTTLLADAEARGDLYAATMFSLRFASVQLLADDPGGARRSVTTAMERWSQTGFHTPHLAALQRQTEIDLYTGDVAAARRRITTAWPQLKRSLLLRNQIANVESTYLLGRTALAAAAAGIEARGLDEAVSMARLLERQRVTWSLGLAGLLRGAIAAIGGRKKDAEAALAEAGQLLESADMALHSSAALRRRGELVGGAAGQRYVEEADARLVARGIANPARFTALLVPGGV